MSSSANIRILSPSEFAKALSNIGFELVRDNGNARVYKHPDGRISVIKFGLREIERGILRRYLREANITETELEIALDKRKSKLTINQNNKRKEK